MQHNSLHIYDHLFPVLWKSISSALKICIKYDEAGKFDMLSEANTKLIKCFDEILEARPVADKHIREGLFDTHRDRKGVYPRVLKLTLKAFEDAKKINARGGYLLPSPLYIIYQLFTVPEQAYTAAYAITSCRTFLFTVLQIHPSHPILFENESKLKLKRLFTETQVTDALADFESFEEQKGRWPKEIVSYDEDAKLKTPEVQSFVGHFLASKGIAHLWFGKKVGDDLKKEDSVKTAFKFLSFEKDKPFITQIREKLREVRFRRSARFRELPDWGEVINQVFGFPIPIKGADVVFFGGLKPSSSGGLVMSVSGRAGVGKTSFALTLANAFSPFGTQCFYISLEEELDDIIRRLQTLRPHIQKELGFFSKNLSWFKGLKYPGNVTLDLFTEEISALVSELSSIWSDLDSTETSLPPICPYIIVVDNITELVADFEFDHYAQIERFIERCRSLNAIVLLLSPEGLVEKFKIDYLVDIGLELKHKDIEKDDAKPTRIFNLFKTRQQLSRQGAHIFHLSGPDGFRISPQIPSQIDRKESFHRNLFDETRIIHTLNFLNDDSIDSIVSTINYRNDLFVQDKNAENINEFFLELFPRTHILIHGFGSSGKAGFAIKLLLTPPIEKDISLSKIAKKKFDHIKNRRNILIISFLYPQKYYEGLIDEKKNIQGIIQNTFDNLENPLVEYLVLYPGYLTPQDFLNKVTRKLDEANLKGQPFTGVLIDGLHNVFLQFENLQNNNMVWPMLYNILARYDLTVVSTFTNFSLNDKLIEQTSLDKNQIVNQAVPDHLLLQKGMAPFLHALVKASDYYFFMEQLTSTTGNKKYLLAVKGSISNFPEEILEWDRDRNVFKALHSVQMVNNWELGK